MSDPFAACEEIVRRHDPDRFFAALFAPEERRRHLFVLYALYYELAHAVQAAREPMLADIRLMWWCETVEGARAGTPRDHAVAQALAATLSAHDLPQPLFDTMIEARGRPGEPFTDIPAAEAYADAGVGALMRLAVRVLSGGEAEARDGDAVVRDAAIAYAVAGRHDGLFHAIDTNALARDHYRAARRAAIPKAVLPAFLPAALVPLYLKRPDPPLWRKQISLLRAAMLGRV